MWIQADQTLPRRLIFTERMLWALDLKELAAGQVIKTQNEILGGGRTGHGSVGKRWVEFGV